VAYALCTDVIHMSYAAKTVESQGVNPQAAPSRAQENGAPKDAVFLNCRSA